MEVPWRYPNKETGQVLHELWFHSTLPGPQGLSKFILTGTIFLAPGLSGVMTQVKSTGQKYLPTFSGCAVHRAKTEVSRIFTFSINKA